MLSSVDFSNKIEQQILSKVSNQLIKFDKYTPQTLNWNNINEILYTIIPATDSNSLLYCLATVFDEHFLFGNNDESGLDKKEAIRKFRFYLAQYLQSDTNGVINYQTLSGGKLIDFSKQNPALSLSNMVGLLNSDDPIGRDYLELISNIINCDIYVLNFSTKNIDLSKTEEPFLIKNRRSVILLYIDYCYQLVYVVRESCGQFLFSHDDPLILELKNLIK